MKSETSITFVDRFANSTRDTHCEKTWSGTAESRRASRARCWGPRCSCWEAAIRKWHL